MATIKYKFEPRAYQIPLLKAFDNGIKRLVKVWHRRSGKDLVDLNIMIAAMIERVGNYYYYLPSYNQARKVIWEGKTKDGTAFLDYFPPELVESRNESEMKVKLKNGSLFKLVGVDNIDSIVGTNPVGNVFSEYSIEDPKGWQFIRPILAENDGWAIFNYTPRGMNHGWKLLEQAKTNPGWFWEILTVDDTGAISKEALEEERRGMPQDLFEQEYYCRFLEGAGAVFKRIDEAIKNGPYSFTAENRFQLGWDLAKMRDFTVGTAFNLNTFQVYPQDRFNIIDYNLQKARIEAFYYKYNKGLTRIDSTGVGEPIFDDLTPKIPRLEGYKFTEQSRKDLLQNLQLLLEQNKIRLPEDEILINELKSFQYELTDTGKTKMTVPEGLHDDCVMSLALAVWNIPSKELPIPSIEQRELLKQFDFYKQKKQMRRYR